MLMKVGENRGNKFIRKYQIMKEKSDKKWSWRESNWRVGSYLDAVIRESQPKRRYFS